MALIYTLVKRRDMSKGALEGAQLYYAQTSVTKRLDLNTICSRIEMYCTASRGEIILVLDGLIKVMNEALAEGESIHLGEFGIFNNPRNVFYPGTLLIGTTQNAKFERYVPKKDAEAS